MAKSVLTALENYYLHCNSSNVPCETAVPLIARDRLRRARINFRPRTPPRRAAGGGSSAKNAAYAKNDRPLVSFVIPGLGLSGAEIVTTTLAKELFKRGCAADIVTLADIDGPSQVLPEGFARCASSVQKSAIFRFLLRDTCGERVPRVVASMWPITSACIVGRQLAFLRASHLGHSTLSVQYATRGALHRRLLRTSIAWTYPLAHARIVAPRGPPRTRRLVGPAARPL